MRAVHGAVIVIIGCFMFAYMGYAAWRSHHDGVMAAMVIGCSLILATDLAFWLVRWRGGK